MDGQEIWKKIQNKLEKKFKIDEFKSLLFYYSGLNVRSTASTRILG